MPCDYMPPCLSVGRLLWGRMGVHAMHPSWYLSGHNTLPQRGSTFSHQGICAHVRLFIKAVHFKCLHAKGVLSFTFACAGVQHAPYMAVPGRHPCACRHVSPSRNSTSVSLLTASFFFFAIHGHDTGITRVKRRASHGAGVSHSAHSDTKLQSGAKSKTRLVSEGIRFCFCTLFHWQLTPMVQIDFVWDARVNTPCIPYSTLQAEILHHP